LVEIRGEEQRLGELPSQSAQQKQFIGDTAASAALAP